MEARSFRGQLGKFCKENCPKLLVPARFVDDVEVYGEFRTAHSHRKLDEYNVV